jgi:nucleoside recognition membrane protein YjiH
VEQFHGEMVLSHYSVVAGFVISLVYMAYLGIKYCCAEANEKMLLNKQFIFFTTVFLIAVHNLLN